MTWEPFSLHFKQVYDGGYRYLDRCGQLMLLAEQRLRLMPEDAKPSGMKMSIPESGIVVAMNPTELIVTQEFYTDSGEEFIELCQKLVEMVQDVFAPNGVASNGILSKTCFATTSNESAQKASLRLEKGLAVELAKDVEMPARQESIDCHFGAGSMDLHVQINPVTFSRLTMQRFNPPPLATSTQTERLKRLNQRADRMNTSLSHGMMMELDLIEFDPPPDSLRKHFDLLLKKQSTLQARFKLA